jgi:hypothetical protein
MALVAPASAQQENEPFAVAADEVRSHRISDFPFFRLVLPPCEAAKLNGSLKS